MKKVSRMESNKEVRRVLARHGADMCYCTYSCSGHEIRLSGSLVRTDGTDYNGHQIEAMIQDFMRHLHGFTIHGEFDNWNFGNDHISRLGQRQAYEEDEEVEGQEEAA